MGCCTNCNNWFPRQTKIEAAIPDLGGPVNKVTTAPVLCLQS